MSTSITSEAYKGFVEKPIASSLSTPGSAVSCGNIDLTLHTIDDILVERCLSVPDIPLVGFPDSVTSSSSYIYHTVRDLDRYVNGAIDVLAAQAFGENTSKHRKTVALLGVSNLDYLVSMFAFSRMGYSVLFLSTRLSTEAYVNLLSQTDCSAVFFCPATSKATAGILEQFSLHIYEIPIYAQYQNGKPTSDLKLRGTEKASNEIAMIIHSSGSTGLPKPIFQTHRSCIANYTVSKPLRPFLTLPLFHNHGLCTFFRALLKTKCIAFFNPALPMTGKNLLEALNAVLPESFNGVPYALKLLSETQNGIQALAKCQQVLFGGSSCPDEIGDRLVAGGVKLISHYGATEMGQLMTSDRPDSDTAWNYVRPIPAVAEFIDMRPLDDGTYECVVLDGASAKVISNCNDPPNSFRTSDCFTPHPDIKNAWKYLGRIDDRITLMNGEKVLPLPIEHRIRQSNYVQDALIFGVGKTLPGVLVMPSNNAKGMNRIQLLEKIWPEIEGANANAESFSQISEDMVEFLEVGTIYPVTDKGTMIRKACWMQFANVIDKIYARFESGASLDGVKKLALGAAGLEEYLLNLLDTQLGFKNFSPEQDFFAHGMDSLQAIKLSGLIKRGIDVGQSEISNNIAFECGNVKQLARHLYALRVGESVVNENEESVMAQLIDKYSDFRCYGPEQENCVLITGVTGSLGVYVMSRLMQDPLVQRIYCLTRAKTSSEALERVIATLVARGLPIIGIHKVKAYPASLGDATLGLNGDVLFEIRRSLTKVIHLAWAVNFNLGVRSFEAQHIAGVHNLINLCLSVQAAKPAEFYFASSISAAAGTPLPARIVEGPIPQLAHAQNIGYARSKLVAERIIINAVRKTGMVARVLRVGQIVGDTVSGRWNTTEAIPLMIQSAITMGALPSLDETPSWLPVDVVAQSVLELAKIGKITKDKDSEGIDDPSVVYHVQNSCTFNWTSDLLPALRQAGLNFETISQREWVQRLRDCAATQDVQANPAVKLLSFYEDKYDNDSPGRRDLSFEMEKTELRSPSLRGGVDLIHSGLVKKFVQRWLKDWKEQS